MKLNKVILLLLATSLIFFVGCENEDETTNEFEVLVEYLEGDDGGYMNNMGDWILAEGSINLEDYLVLDLRSAAVFDTTPNPIAGAVNTTLTDMWTHAEIATKPILVTCYSGQTASFAHMLLRLKGFDAYVMKFGMSWHDESLDKWTVKCVDTYANDLVSTVSPALPSFDYPELNTGETTGESILDSRIDVAIEAWGTLLISASDVFSDPTVYNIINYWSEADYLDHGHIYGAFQVTPATLTIGNNLSVFDPDGDNIFYCYTGQTAASAVAYLTVLGYDVKSIAYGFNNIYWSELPGHKWPKPYGG